MFPAVPQAAPPPTSSSSAASFGSGAAAALRPLTLDPTNQQKAAPHSKHAATATATAIRPNAQTAFDSQAQAVLFAIHASKLDQVRPVANPTANVAAHAGFRTAGH